MVSLFLKGVNEVANQATDTAKKILKLFQQDEAKIEDTGKSAASALIIFNYLKQHPITDTNKIAKLCKLTLPKVLRSLENLEALNIVRETTGKTRHRIYVYQGYLDLLSDGMEPIKN